MFINRGCFHHGNTPSANACLYLDAGDRVSVPNAIARRSNVGVRDILYVDVYLVSRDGLGQQPDMVFKTVPFARFEKSTPNDVRCVVWSLCVTQGPPARSRALGD